MMGSNTDSEKNQKSRVGKKFSGHSKQHKNWCLSIQERQIRWVLAVLLFSAEFQMVLIIFTIILAKKQY